MVLNLFMQPQKKRRLLCETSRVRGYNQRGVWRLLDAYNRRPVFSVRAHQEDARPLVHRAVPEACWESPQGRLWCMDLVWTRPREWDEEDGRTTARVINLKGKRRWLWAGKEKSEHEAVRMVLMLRILDGRTMQRQSMVTLSHGNYGAYRKKIFFFFCKQVLNFTAGSVTLTCSTRRPP